MQVKCVICDRVETLDEHSLIAKRMRNHGKRLYLCKTCYNRIGENTKKRLATGKFRLYKERPKSDELI